MGRAWGVWLLCAVLWPGAQAQTQAPQAQAEAPPAAGDAPRADDDARPAERRREAPRARFDIELQAPDEVRDLLLRHMALQRFRTLRGLDAEELERLLAQAPEDIRNLLGTQGYFAPTIHVDPVAPGDAPLGTVRLRVDTGPATEVASVGLYFRGDIAGRAEAEGQRASIREDWSLAAGARFTQSGWSGAKAGALRALTAHRYPLARVYNSLADIDPGAHQAHLSVEFDSGPLVRLGEMRIEGDERYDASIARNLLTHAGLKPGSDYDLAVLQDAQQRLSQTGYYEVAYVTVEPSANGEPATVQVQLREAPLQQLTLGVGASTDSGPRFSLEHTHHRVPLIDWRSQLTLQLQRDDSVARSEWSSPILPHGWRWIASAQAARQIDDDTTTTSQRLRWGRSQEGKLLDRSLFVQADRARATSTPALPTDTDGYEAALSLNLAWTGRRFDALPFPRSGYGLGIEVGVGTTIGQDHHPFTRGQVRWLNYWPLSSDPDSLLGRLMLRVEGGAVWAQREARIPRTLLFLTGGDATVRGYSLRSIGIAQADGRVSPGRYMAVAGLEWQRPISRGSNWEHVVFIDAGSVTNDVKDWPVRRGIGTGVRYNSPVGPLQVDLAWGEQPRRWRLHLNVGFSF